MKNKFIQKIVGECAIVVIANILNNEKVIKDRPNFTKGTNAIEQRKILEAYSDYTFRGIFEVRKARQGRFPVFELDEDFTSEQDKNRDHYCLFLAGLKQEGKKGHAILVIKENHNKTLTILDPLKGYSTSIHQDNFFEEIPCVSLDIVCDKEDGGYMFFYESTINHLKDN